MLINLPSYPFNIIKRRHGAQPEIKSLLKGHGDFSHQAKGALQNFHFATRPEKIAYYYLTTPRRFGGRFFIP
jgi:hypothetical protein